MIRLPQMTSRFFVLMGGNYSARMMQKGPRNARALKSDLVGQSPFKNSRALSFMPPTAF